MLPGILPVGDLAGSCGWDGSEWRRIKVTAEGALVLQTYGVVFDWTATANVDYVDVTGLDAQSHWGYWIYILQHNPTGSTATLYMYCNGDYTGSNYYVQHLLGDGTSVYAGRYNAAPLGGAFAGQRSLHSVIITLVPGGYPMAIALVAQNVGSTINVFYRSWCYTVAVSNLTSLRFQSNVAGGIGAGSKILIYRLK